jgi:hypothetical protein
MNRTLVFAGVAALMMSSAIAQRPSTSNAVQATADAAQVIPAQSHDDLLVSKLKERGLNSKDISSRFENETAEAKNFAYDTAKEIKKQQKR